MTVALNPFDGELMLLPTVAGGITSISGTPYYISTQATVAADAEQVQMEFDSTDETPTSFLAIDPLDDKYLTFLEAGFYQAQAFFFFRPEPTTEAGLVGVYATLYFPTGSCRGGVGALPFDGTDTSKYSVLNHTSPIFPAAVGEQIQMNMQAWGHGWGAPANWPWVYVWKIT